MAEARVRFGRGAYDSAHEICKRYLLESPNKQAKSAITTSSIATGYLSGDIQNAADRVTFGVSQDNYTLFDTVNAVGKDAGVADYHLGLNEDSLPNKTQVHNIELRVPQYRSDAECRRSHCTFSSARRQQRLCSLRGEQLTFIRAYSGNETRPEPLYRTKTAYYEILEVTPTATQAQIKTAYYKQSFVHHPDRKPGGAATARFSEISEAYSVLGNKALRKKYDRGLLSHVDLIATAGPSARGTAGSSKQTEGRRSVVGGDSRGGVFDFDKFFKCHYSEQLQRERDIRVRKEEMRRKRETAIGERPLGGMMEMGVAVMLAMAMAIVISIKLG